MGTTTFVNTSGAYRYALALSGNDAVLTVSTVPEPATLGLLGIAAAGLLRRRRRVT